MHSYYGASIVTRDTADYRVGFMQDLSCVTAVLIVGDPYAEINAVFEA